ncbi:hypothetical protein DUI87_02532 [Hirundo rustica rustica]|uniref:Uncharacterized protein n=1 Tax=Hirundo rustica rustica TaxID=333673 RepID=A0A3M0LCI8_HIRRU|nr:hypothetical protein DUI87_02532 [Hirundo rustica rustica]
MDRQAAYDLFASLLKRRGVKGLDLDKDLPSLLGHAASYGFFANPHAVHELAEWRKYGDKLWELVLDDDKSAKKMSKFWKIVQNELLKCEAEKQAVVAAKEAQGKNKIYYGHPSDPNPPRVAFVDLPPPQTPPTAPPLPSNADPPSPTPPDPPPRSRSPEPFRTSRRLWHRAGERHGRLWRNRGGKGKTLSLRRLPRNRLILVLSLLFFNPIRKGAKELSL